MYFKLAPDKPRVDLREWHRVFAWWPVRLGLFNVWKYEHNYTKGAWLCFVERRYIGKRTGRERIFEYREAGSGNDP